MTLTLLLGGARSGKSTRAVEVASQYDVVSFIATAEALDDDMAQRIARHRGERPKSWRTIEVARDVDEIEQQLEPAGQAIVLDCLTLWVSNLLLAGLDEAAILTEAERLLIVVERKPAHWIVVSNEVGLGVPWRHSSIPITAVVVSR